MHLEQIVFFVPDQRHYSRLGILKNPALKTRKGAKAWKVVKLTKGGLGFHKSKTLPPSPEQDKFLKSFYLVK